MVILDSALANRFELRRPLGAGGQGEVLAVYDRIREEEVALKILRAGGADGLLRLKREFRALHDLRHPNLARHHDLFVDTTPWCFTMEVVEGADLGHDLAARRDSGHLARMLAQLARGLAALHEVGRVHRDLKPGNVMVAPGGRVVLLDFGLVVDRTRGLPAEEGVLVGTVAYMSPEQAAADRLVGPPTDLYALGVILFEWLTGRLPFTGPPMTSLLRRVREDAPDVRVLAPDAPSTLTELTMRLLAREAAARPTARDVVEWLRPLGGDGVVRAASIRPPANAGFHGRVPERARLGGAFAAVERGCSGVITIEGPSGLGKTALAEEFATGLEQAGKALVLRGRCHPGEHVRFNVLDGALDDLATHLSGRGRDTTALLERGEWDDLARVFPAFESLRKGARLADPRPGSPGNLARSAAFAALVRLVGGLAATTPLVFLLDDAQWADDDSVSLVRALARREGGAVLFLVTYVEDDPRSRRVVEEFEAESRQRPEALRYDRISLEPLPDDVCRTIVVSRLDPSTPALIEGVVNAAEGSPIALIVLARFAASGRFDGARGVDDVVESEVHALDPEARRILRSVALAEGPIPRDVLLEIFGRTLASALLRLETDGLLEALTARDRAAVMVPHHRLRQAVLRGASAPERAALHAELAEGFETLGPDYADDAAFHHLRAGAPSRAVRHLLRGAERAESMYALERAADLRMRALEHASDQERVAMLARLTPLLVETGRGRAALPLLDERLRSASPDERPEIHRERSRAMLSTGLVDEAIEELSASVRDVGVVLSASRARLILQLLFARLRLAGTRPATEPRMLDEAAQRKLDAIRAAGGLFLLLEPIRGAVLESHRARLAFQSGQPVRVLESLVNETILLAGVRRFAAAHRVLRDAEERYAKGGAESVEAGMHMARGTLAYCEWRLDDAEDHYRRGIDSLRTSRSVMGQDGSVIRAFACFTAMAGGRFRTGLEGVVELEEDARRRGDLIGRVIYGSAARAFYELARDRPDVARAAVRAATADLPEQPYRFLHLLRDGALSAIDLYDRRYDDVAARWNQAYPAAEGAGLFRHVINKARVDQIMAVTAAARGDAKAARKFARGLDGRLGSGIAASGALALAGLALGQGDRDAARVALERAERGLAPYRFEAWRAACQFALAQLTTGEASLAHAQRANVWFEEEGIVCPEKLVAMYVPNVERASA